MADDDFTPKNSYQDDVDTDPNQVDEVTHGATDDSSDSTGVPAEDLKEDLDKQAVDETDSPDSTPEQDDARNDVEDKDEDGVKKDW